MEWEEKVENGGRRGREREMEMEGGGLTVADKKSEQDKAMHKGKDRALLRYLQRQ